MQFFTAFGWLGVGTALVSMFLFSSLGAMLLHDGHTHQTNSDREIWVRYCGTKLGTVIDIFSSVFTAAVFMVMIGGAGATINQYTGLPNLVGSVIMSILCLITALLGLEKLVDIIGAIGPVIIVFSLFIGTYSLFTNLDNLATASQTMETMTLTKSCGNWFQSALLYVGENSLLFFCFLFQLSRSAKTAKGGAAGGAVGGFFLTLAILVMHLAFMANISDVYDKAIPSLTLASEISPLLAGFFTVTVMMGIYSTTVPLLWMTCRKTGPDGSKKFITTAIIMTIAALIVSRFPFATLVNTVYPFAGYVGVFAIIAVFVKHFKKEKNLNFGTVIQKTRFPL